MLLWVVTFTCTNIRPISVFSSIPMHLTSLCPIFTHTFGDIGYICSSKLELLFVYSVIFKDYIILDEGHKIKNPSMKTSKNVREVPAKNHFILTGTPVQNNLRVSTLCVIVRWRGGEGRKISKRWPQQRLICLNHVFMRNNRDDIEMTKQYGRYRGLQTWMKALLRTRHHVRHWMTVWSAVGHFLDSVVSFDHKYQNSFRVCFLNFILRLSN